MWRSIFDAARNNDEKAVRYFIEEKNVPVTYTNKKYQTVAHIATLNGNLPILEYVLSKDAPSLLKALDVDKNNILFLAIQQGFFEIVRFLVEFHRVDILEKNIFHFGNNAVHTAARAGHLDILKYFIEGHRVDVNVKNDLLETPVFYAAEGQHLEIVKYLVEEKNANVTSTDWNGDNILYVSAKMGDVKVPKYLLDEKRVMYDINYRDKSGDTVVVRAARYDQLNFIKYVVEEKQADVNIGDDYNRTPLWHAASLNHFEVVRYLGENGADITIADDFDVTPDKVSIKDDVIKYLKAKNNALNEKLKKEKELARQKVREEKELAKQKLKEEKKLSRQKLKEEKELFKLKMKEEKELKRKKLKEEKESGKGKLNNEEKKLLKNSTKRTPKRSKNLMRGESTLMNSTDSKTSTESTKNFSNETLQINLSSSSGQLRTAMNLSRDELDETSNKSEDTAAEGGRNRRSAVESHNFHSLVGRFPHRGIRSVNSFWSYPRYSSHFPILPHYNSWQLNNFLVTADVCLRYFNVFNNQRPTRKRNVFTLMYETTQQVRMDLRAVEAVHALPVHIT